MSQSLIAAIRQAVPADAKIEFCKISRPLVETGDMILALPVMEPGDRIYVIAVLTTDAVHLPGVGNLDAEVSMQPATGPTDPA